jgi:hypothetical protein
MLAARRCSGLPRIVPVVPWENTDALAPADSTEPSDPAEPIEKAEPNDPIDPIDSAEPTEPSDRKEPTEPTDRNELSDQSDSPSMWYIVWHAHHDSTGAVLRFLPTVSSPPLTAEKEGGGELTVVPPMHLDASWILDTDVRPGPNTDEQLQSR